MMEGRSIYGAEHEELRRSVRKFFERELLPHIDAYEEDGIIPKELWRKAGEMGILCPTVGPEYGGIGGDFLHLCIIDEELGYTGQSSFTIQTHTDIVAAYLEALGTEEQKQRWLPRMVTGEMIGAVAMTEPQAGSDLKAITTSAVRDGDEFVINGSKTFITNGINADFVIVVCKTAPELGRKGVSLIVVDGEREGFKRGKRLKKMGMKASDTAELFFDNVRVPVSNLLGSENSGFTQVMHEIPKERLSIATIAMASAQKAFDTTVAYVKERMVFGKPLIEFQNTQFKLAELKTHLTVGWAHLDHCITKHLKHELTSDEAAIAKLFNTELQCRVVDECLQLHGGWGYMSETPISRMYVDARVRRIAGGSSEIMKVLIARTL
ncbi:MULTISPECIES: acyl-CoA dehydrogenase family protein [unclassified Chelatococcus]|uniref:acyl-CoA dehydrogenase family protein n=1 Tax=unclassified Chelatococcus TaxID=2638111 RepID=UPI0020BEED78|nr:MULTISPECIES: acyl-CoA dehydrogenase family protein [unclassified Chelatococcus]